MDRVEQMDLERVGETGGIWTGMGEVVSSGSIMLGLACTVLHCTMLCFIAPQCRECSSDSVQRCYLGPLEPSCEGRRADSGAHRYCTALHCSVL